jgi:hypothetical protein
MTQLLRRTLGLLFPDNASVREETNLWGKLNSIMAPSSFHERRKQSARYYFVSPPSDEGQTQDHVYIGFRYATRQRTSILWGSRGRNPMVFTTSATRTTTQGQGRSMYHAVDARHDEGRRPTSFSRQLRNAGHKIGTAAVLRFQMKHDYYYWVSRTAPQVSRNYIQY